MFSDAATALAGRLSGYLRETDLREGQLLVRRAYAVAFEKHDGQKRRSGEPYIDHPVAVAGILIDLRLDAQSVAAALLHDVVEDTGTTREQIEQCFGHEVAHLVDGVTKLNALENQSKEDAQAGSYRKMFVAMADDMRVVLVKLADRLHNMRTIQYSSAESQQRNARETMDIYAPLANRLGIWKIKSELEDRSFAILNPEKYQEISRSIAARRAERQPMIDRVIERLKQELVENKIVAEISGRPKHIYSIYRKMERKGVSLEQIYDQLAVRVIVGEPIKAALPEEPVADQGGRKLAVNRPAELDRSYTESWHDPDTGLCYQVLGIVHSIWAPVRGEFDDYIARPKESLYRSLHTTVMIPGGQPCEVQIRTQRMHVVAENGVAAHWRYKEGFGAKDPSFDAKLAWLRQLIEWRHDMTDNQEFVESVKQEELDEQVYVFTPKGKIVDLPSGSTPVDFAYRIHSKVGESCTGAKVNGKIVTLDYQLKNGEICEVITSRTPRGPSRDWLNYVKTSGARNHIRRFFNRLRRDENITAGRAELEKELKRLGMQVAYEEVAQSVGLRLVDDLFAQIGSGELIARQLAQKLLALQVRQEQERRAQDAIPTSAPQRPKREPKGVQVRGVDSVLTRIARCCSPVLGEPIVGFVTRGRGVTIHRADCRTVVNEVDKGRLLEVSWGTPEKSQGFSVPVRIESWDRVGLWRDISAVVADAGINIEEVKQVQLRRQSKTVLEVVLTIHSLAQLTMILDKVNRLPNIIEARRVGGLPGD